jgi:hypothetical protein
VCGRGKSEFRQGQSGGYQQSKKDIFHFVAPQFTFNASPAEGS